MSRGRKWTRKVATILLALDVLAAFFAIEVATLLPDEAVYVESVVAAAVVLQLASIFLLWAPGSSKTYFMKRRAD